MMEDRSFWVGVWWAGLSGFSVLNILTWVRILRSRPASRGWQALFAGIFVWVCAFRSFLPRADVQRICLIDSWLSSVAVGRSVATVAELSFAAQWAIYLYELGRAAGVRSTMTIAKMVVPLIAVAEAFSWYAVLTTNYVGNVVEQSTWTLTAILCAAAVVVLIPRCGGELKRLLLVCCGVAAFYVCFMLSVDVPMYGRRLIADAATGRHYLSIGEGAYDAAHRWVVTRSWSDWRQEMAWMGFYFTAAVWISIWLIRAPRYEPEAVESLVKNDRRGTGPGALR